MSGARDDIGPFGIVEDSCVHVLDGPVLKVTCFRSAAGPTRLAVETHRLRLVSTLAGSYSYVPLRPVPNSRDTKSRTFFSSENWQKLFFAGNHWIMYAPFVDCLDRFGLQQSHCRLKLQSAFRNMIYWYRVNFDQQMTRFWIQQMCTCLNEIFVRFFIVFFFLRN